MSGVMILGAGGWGTALGVMCARFGTRVTLWSPFDKDIDALRKDRENRRLLPGVALPPEMELTTDLAPARDAEAVVVAVPSFAVRQTAARLHGLPLPAGKLVTVVSKGLEEGSLLRMSQVIGQELPDARVVALSGPSHAEEVSRGVPTAVVAASADIDAARRIQDLFMNPTFRIYVNADIVGAELGGALKNIIALAAGICDGLGLGDNTKAALMTRGITEMARLGAAMGGCPQTFAGLTGIGDLIVTCTSMHSRNRRAGILIGQGLTGEAAVEKVGMTVEGYNTARAARELARRAGVDMPIVAECCCVLFEGKDPRKAIEDLMGRQKKHEMEDAWVPGQSA